MCTPLADTKCARQQRADALGPLQTNPKEEIFHGPLADLDLKKLEADPETGEVRGKRLRPASSWQASEALEELGEDFKQILKP